MAGHPAAKRHHSCEESRGRPCPHCIETEQEEAKPGVDWPASWELARQKGLSPSQKSTLFNWTQNLLINGERLHRTGLKENPSCEACGHQNDNREHFFDCKSFPRSSLGVQKMLLQLTREESSKEDLTVLHVKLTNSDHRLPFAFLMSELIKGVLTQKKTRRKRSQTGCQTSSARRTRPRTTLPRAPLWPYALGGTVQVKRLRLESSANPNNI